MTNGNESSSNHAGEEVTRDQVAIRIELTTAFGLICDGWLSSADFRETDRNEAAKECVAALLAALDNMFISAGIRELGPPTLREQAMLIEEEIENAAAIENTAVEELFDV